MASISLIHATSGSTTSTSSTSFTEVVESDALPVEGRNYYIVCHCLCEGTDANGVFEWRLYDASNNAVISNSTMIREVASAGIAQSYYYVGRVTAGNRGGGIRFEQRTTNGMDTVSTHFVSIMIFDLSDMKSADYFYANDTTFNKHDATWDTQATYTLTSPKTNDEYLMWGWVSSGMNNVSVSGNMALYEILDKDGPGESVDVGPTVLYEGEDLSEQLNWGVCRYSTYDNSGDTVTWEVRVRDDTIPGNPDNHNEHLESTVFGFRLNAFEDFFGSYTDAETTTSATTWQEFASESFTPTSDGDVVIAGCSIFGASSTNHRSRERMQVDGVSSPNSVTDSEWFSNATDGTDDLPLTMISKYTGSGGVGATLDLDVKKSTSTVVGWSQYTLSGFTTKLAGKDATYRNMIGKIRYGTRRRQIVSNKGKAI